MKLKTPEPREYYTGINSSLSTRLAARFWLANDCKTETRGLNFFYHRLTYINCKQRVNLILHDRPTSRNKTVQSVWLQFQRKLLWQLWSAIRSFAHYTQGLTARCLSLFNPPGQGLWLYSGSVVRCAGHYATSLCTRRPP